MENKIDMIQVLADRKELQKIQQRMNTNFSVSVIEVKICPDCGAEHTGEDERCDICLMGNAVLPCVSGWHFLPEMPEIYKEVLVAVKYDNEPVQAFWTGKDWRGSFLVRDNMADGFVRDESYKHIQEWIYAWIELPKVPPIP